MREDSGDSRLSFTAKIIKGSESLKPGSYSAELTSSDLVLRKGSESLATFPVGTKVERGAKGQLILRHGGTQVTLQVVKINGYLDRISQSISGVLSGEGSRLKTSDHEFPLALFALVVLPLGLMVVGGLVGGAIGGAVAGLNLYLIRQHRWPMAVRVLVSLFASGVVYSAFIAVVIVWALVTKLNSMSNRETLNQPAQMNGPAPIENVEASPPAPQPPILASLVETQLFRIAGPTEPIQCALVRDDRVSLLIGCADGSIMTVSMLDQEPQWKLVARLPVEPQGIRKLTSDYYLLRGGEETYLMTPGYKLLKMPWNWESLPSSTILFVSTPEGLFTGTINFGILEQAASGSSSGLDVASIQTASLEFLESKDGGALKIDAPSGIDLGAISASGVNPIGFGFSDGTIALKVSSEWLIERTRNQAVSCLGQGQGFGYADGVVDTGFVDETLRFRQCGTSAIRRLVSHQAWTVAINEQGEAWAFVPQGQESPIRVFADESVGEVQELLQLDYATAIVTSEGVTFMSGELLNSQFVGQ